MLDKNGYHQKVNMIIERLAGKNKEGQKKNVFNFIKVKDLRKVIRDPDKNIKEIERVERGDIVKAFAAGADFVMIGGMLAGHDECDGIVKDGVMKFYGMASKSAMDRHKITHREYRGVEGKTVYVKHKGPVNDTLIDILSGIRSACTYVGAKKLKSLSYI